MMTQQREAQSAWKHRQDAHRKTRPRGQPLCRSYDSMTQQNGCEAERGNEQFDRIREAKPEGVLTRQEEPQDLEDVHRTCGKPRLTLLVEGSGQRLVTTLPRV